MLSENKNKEQSITVFHYSKIPNNFNNSRFVEKNNLDVVIEQLKKQFEPGKTYTAEEAISKIRLYF